MRTLPYSTRLALYTTVIVAFPPLVVAREMRELSVPGLGFFCGLTRVKALEGK